MDHEYQQEESSLFKGCFLSVLIMLAGIAIGTAFCSQCQAQPAQLVIKSIPIATTMPVGDGRWWDTGISIVNISPAGTNVVINRMEFFDSRGDGWNIGFGFNIVIKPNTRWSKMLSEIIPRERDGVLQVHVMTPSTGKWYLYESVFVDPTHFVVIEAKDVTSRIIQ